jgi:hypothetical protein
VKGGLSGVVDMYKYVVSIYLFVCLFVYLICVFVLCIWLMAEGGGSSSIDGRLTHQFTPPKKTGLGYYRRARMLQAGARALLEKHEGKLPATVEELLTISGKDFIWFFMYVCASLITIMVD